MVTNLSETVKKCELKTLSGSNIRMIDLTSEPIEVTVNVNSFEQETSSMIESDDNHGFEANSKHIENINSDKSCKNNHDNSRIRVNTISGYAFFVKHERAELDKINTKLKLNMIEINDKWKRLPENDKKIFLETAKNYKHSNPKTVRVPEVKQKVTKPKRLTSRKKVLVEKVKCLTNMEFVDAFENIELKVNELEGRNKKLSQLIFETKMIILQRSHELHLKDDSEALYKARHQRLLTLHEKCHK
jgi:hypothetical protein